MSGVGIRGSMIGPPGRGKSQDTGSGERLQRSAPIGTPILRSFGGRGHSMMPGSPPSALLPGVPAMRTTWTFHAAGQLLFGRHATRQLGDVAGQLGARRVLLVTDPVLLKAGVVEQVHIPLSE